MCSYKKKRLKAIASKRAFLQRHGVSAATWDKHPGWLHAIFAKHANMALLNLTILCPSLELLGIQTKTLVLHGMCFSKPSIGLSTPVF